MESLQQDQVFDGETSSGMHTGLLADATTTDRNASYNTSRGFAATQELTNDALVPDAESEVGRGGNKRELSPFLRGKIVGASEFGASIRNIAKRYGIPKSTVHNTVQKAITRPNDGKSLPRHGRPPIYNLQEEQAIVNKVQEKPDMSFTELRQVTGTKLSAATVRRLLKKHGIKYGAAKGVLTKTRSKSEEAAFDPSAAHPPNAYTPNTMFMTGQQIAMSDTMGSDARTTEDTMAAFMQSMASSASAGLQSQEMSGNGMDGNPHVDHASV